MKKGIKKMAIIVGVIVGLLIIIIAISFINHKIHLSKENRIFVPNGKLVEVNGHKIHIYTEGHGMDTLVFMSGGGTCSPVLDFKSLYSLLSDKYKIVVVEKAGYGFSEISDINRDIDTILEETRIALSKSGLQAPYILFPHSMSGIEALYWAQQYPKEIKGIVGLDMALPQTYENYSINHFMLNIGSFTSKIGITRFFPAVVNSSSSIKYGTLTDEEKDLYRAIFYRRTLTKPMISEVNEIKTSAEKVKKNGVPDVPMLFFISNGNGTGWNKDEWIGFQTHYIETTGSNKFIKLDCGHYIHGIEYKRIADESKQFIKDIININEHNDN
ncbi:alpha/beta hydrolase [Clostridium sediminicola]|uniref:alpha/beta fold hydrolase n=1 Tax=Clostridium sediminicola TaxID=3114879 RepID=UPI0031F1DC39